MKKKLSIIIITMTMSMTLFVGCGSASNVSESNDIVTEKSTPTAETTQEPEATPESTDEPHEHTYVETITMEASCETDGEATYTCECGDTYSETIKALGHIYENYTSNNDATYLADGTETAKCNGCDLTDTRTAEGSKLEYTYTEMDATMYAQKTVNVRSMPSTDGEKLGGLSTNDEVKVTGQCVETSWYRIEFAGNVAYVSDGYLGNDKVVVQVQSTSTEFPYELYTLYDNGTYFYYYSLETEGTTKPEHWWVAADACKRANSTRFATYSDWDAARPAREWDYSGYTLNGEKVMKQACYCTVEQTQYLAY